jgi:hypothetical protein
MRPCTSSCSGELRNLLAHHPGLDERLTGHQRRKPQTKKVRNYLSTACLGSSHADILHSTVSTAAPSGRSRFDLICRDLGR